MALKLLRGSLACLLLFGNAVASAQDERFRYGDFTAQIDGLVHPLGADIDADGVIHVVESHAGRLTRVTVGGEVLSRWGEPGTEPGQMLGPHDVAVHAGRAYVTDTGNHRVVVFAADGQVARTWGSLGRGDGHFCGPAGIAVDATHVYVADPGNDRVQVFDHAGTHVRTMGMRGTAPGQFIQPTDVTLNAGRVYVADTGNNRLQVFDADGAHIGTWGEWGPFPGLFDEPTSINVFRDEVHIVDRRNHRVQSFAGSSDPVAVWGTHERIPHEGQGTLHYPDAMAIAPDGSFGIIVEAMEDRIQVFSPGDPNVEPGPLIPFDKRARTHFGDHIDENNGLMSIAEPENHFIYLLDARHEVPIIINEFGERGEGFGLLIRPSGMEVDLEGRTVLVTDLVKREMQQYAIDYDPDGPLRFQPHMTRFVRSVSCDHMSASVTDVDSMWPIEPTALERDADGNVYILDARNCRVFVFDKDLAYLRSWGGYGLGDGVFVRPTSMAFSQDGQTIFVVDQLAARVQAFDLSGAFKHAWGTRGAERGQMITPFGVAAGRDGHVYVADQDGHRILRFDEAGRYDREWGTRGVDMGELWKPRGMAHGQDGRVLVIDHGNHRAQIFESTGKWLVTFGAGRSYTEKTRPRRGQ